MRTDICDGRAHEQSGEPTQQTSALSANRCAGLVPAAHVVVVANHAFKKGLSTSQAFENVEALRDFMKHIFHEVFENLNHCKLAQIMYFTGS